MPITMTTLIYAMITETLLGSLTFDIAYMEVFKFHRLHTT